MVLPMPKAKRTPEAMPSDDLILAAIERAERHRDRPDHPGVVLSTIKEHLGLASNGWTTIQLRPQWEALTAAGFIEQSRRGGAVVWRLTSAGQKQLDSARQTTDIGSLPESPQHHDWREARAIAEAKIGEFRDRLRQVLDEASGMLDAHEQPNSDAWAALSNRLQHACSSLESASYCLHEWPEPDDSHADTPSRQKRGRRSIHRYAND
jgi:hypothetical protein